MKPGWLSSNNQPATPLSDGTVAILLIEEDDELRESRRLLLSCVDAGVRVSDFQSAGRLHVPRGVKLVVISVGASSQTEQVAFQSRRQWPEAKILLIGKSCQGLDDALYDEIIDPCCNPVGFVEMSRRLMIQATEGVSLEDGFESSKVSEV